MAQKVVYAVGKRTSSNSSVVWHLDDGSGKPLCRHKAYSGTSFGSGFVQDTGIVTCKSCLKFMNAQPVEVAAPAEIGIGDYVFSTGADEADETFVISEPGAIGVVIIVDTEDTEGFPYRVQWNSAWNEPGYVGNAYWYSEAGISLVNIAALSSDKPAPVDYTWTPTEAAYAEDNAALKMKLAEQIDHATVLAEDRARLIAALEEAEKAVRMANQLHARVKELEAENLRLCTVIANDDTKVTAEMSTVIRLHEENLTMKRTLRELGIKDVPGVDLYSDA